MSDRHGIISMGLGCRDVRLSASALFEGLLHKGLHNRAKNPRVPHQKCSCLATHFTGSAPSLIGKP